MNLRTQWFAYFTQQLGYAEAAVIRQLDMSDMSAEEYVQRVDLTPPQLNHLRFLFAVCRLLEASRSAGHLSKEQSENMLQGHIVSLIHQPDKLWLLPVARGMVPEKFAEQTSGQLYREGLLNVEEYQLLREAIKASCPLPATTMGRLQPSPGDEIPQSVARMTATSGDETFIDPKIATLADVDRADLVKSADVDVARPTILESPDAQSGDTKATILDAAEPDSPQAASGSDMTQVMQSQMTTQHTVAMSSLDIQQAEAASPPATAESQAPAAGKNEPQQLGHYKLLVEIGCGGMGKVYKAYHQQLDRVVAIKVMLRNQNFGDKERQRFIAEAKLTARLSHPNIIAVHDVASENDTDYIVMDFIEGDSLAAILKKGRLSNRKSLEIIRKVALAIDYAHENDIVHRDLKPGNIMIEKESDRPVVMDFGLAKNIKVGKELTASGEVLGTPRYMAPEQAEGNNRKISPLTDVYALGAILYEMITGSPVVDGSSPVHLFYNIMHKEIIPPRQRNAKISLELETICMKALEKDPARRYPSARAMAEDIERFFNGEALWAHPSGIWYRSWKKVRSHRPAVAMCLLFCLLAGVGVVAIKKNEERKTLQLRTLERERTSMQEWGKWWRGFTQALKTHGELLHKTHDMMAVRRKNLDEGNQLRAKWPHPRQLTHDNEQFKHWLAYDALCHQHWQEYCRLLDSYPKMIEVYEELARDYRQFLSPQWLTSASFFQHQLLPQAQSCLAGVKNSHLVAEMGEQLSYRSMEHNVAEYVAHHLRNKIDILQQPPGTQNGLVSANDLWEWSRWQLRLALALEKGKPSGQADVGRLQEALKKLQNSSEFEYNLALAEYNQVLALLNNMESCEAVLEKCLHRLHTICLADYTFAPAYFLVARIYHLLSATTIASNQRQLAKIYYEKNRDKEKETDFLAGYYLAELSFTMWQAREEKDAGKLQKFFDELAATNPADHDNDEVKAYRQMCILFKTVVANEKEDGGSRFSFLNFTITPNRATRSHPQDKEKYEQALAVYHDLLRQVSVVPASLLRNQVSYWRGKIYMDLGLLEEYPQSGPSYLELAIRDLKDAARWEPWRSEIWWKLGQIHALIGDFKASQDAYHRAFASIADAGKSWSHETHWHYILCLLAGNYEDNKALATTELEKYFALRNEELRKNPFTQAQLSALAMLYVQNGEAKKAYDKVLPDLEFYASTSRVMGLTETAQILVLIKMGLDKEAREALQKLWRHLMKSMNANERSPEIRSLQAAGGLAPSLQNYDDPFMASPGKRKVHPAALKTIDDLVSGYGNKSQQMFSQSVVSYYSVAIKNLLACLETDVEVKQKLPQLAKQALANPVSISLLFLIAAKVGTDTMEQHLLRMDRLPAPELYYRRAIAYYRKALYAPQDAVPLCEKSFADIAQAIASMPGEMAYHYAAAMLAAQLCKKDALWRDQALLHLHQSFELGWDLPAQTREDPAFQELKGERQFQELLRNPPKPFTAYTMHDIWQHLSQQGTDASERRQRVATWRQVIAEKLERVRRYESTLAEQPSGLQDRK